MDDKNNFGGYLENFTEGSIIEHYPGKTITEGDNNLFCLLTRNAHPLHSDIEYCKGTQHGKIVVCGTLVFSLVVGMSVPDISGKAVANLEYESVKHINPVFINDTIYASTEILSIKKTSKGNRGIIYVETTAINQINDVVLIFRRKVLLPMENV